MRSAEGLTAYQFKQKEIKVNLLIATGNIGQDATQRFLPNGDSIVTFSLPVKSGFGDRAKTAWVRCSMFGKRGESVLPYLIKGQLVGVSGEFSMNEWVNKEGQKVSTPEIRVNELDLLGKKSGGDTGNNQPRAEGRTEPADRNRAKAPAGNFDDMESDIPF